jgi:hypothetical protein
MYCTSESEILQSVSTVCYLPVFLGYLHYGRRALIKQSFLLSLGHLPSPVRVSRWYCLYNKDDHPFLDIPMRHHYLSPCRNMIGKTIPLMSFRLAAYLRSESRNENVHPGPDMHFLPGMPKCFLGRSHEFWGFSGGSTKQYGFSRLRYSRLMEFFRFASLHS